MQENAPDLDILDALQGTAAPAERKRIADAIRETGQAEKASAGRAVQRAMDAIALMPVAQPAAARSWRWEAAAAIFFAMLSGAAILVQNPARTEIAAKPAAARAFDSLPEALQSAAAGELVMVKSSRQSGPVRISQPVRIGAVGGPLHIGGS